MPTLCRCAQTISAASWRERPRVTFSPGSAFPRTGYWRLVSQHLQFLHLLITPFYASPPAQGLTRAQRNVELFSQGPYIMSDKIPAGVETERTPEEETLVMRLSVFNKMRWVAILGVIVVTLIARHAFDIGFPTVPVYIVCVFMALYNLVLMQQVRGLRKLRADLVIPRVRQYMYIHIVLDMFALITLLHFAGGIENPFVFFFVFHVVLASMGLSYRVAYLLSTIAIIMVSLLFGLEYAGTIPHINLEGFALPTRYHQPSRILAVLTALAILLYGATSLTTAIAGELRKRQRQVMALRESLLQEKTGGRARPSPATANPHE